MKTIGMYYEKPEAKKLALEVADWLRKKGHKVFTRVNKRILEKNHFDFVVSFGGDGGVIRAANKIVDKEIPLLRVNFGKEGFLTNIEPCEVYEKLARVLDMKDYIGHKRTRIEVFVYDQNNNLLLRKDALNDIVIERSDVSVVYWTVEVGGKIFEFAGDSLVIASPTGSTAYFESAGGRAIVRQDKFGLKISASSNRDDDEATLVRSINFVFNITSIKGKARLNIDGPKALKSVEGYRIEVRKSERYSVFMEIGEVPRMAGD